MLEAKTAGMNADTDDRSAESPTARGSNPPVSRVRVSPLRTGTQCGILCFK